jgi:predicted PurR-regulated permease PerM
MEENGTRRFFPLAAATVIGILAFGAFLVQTKIGANPLVLFLIALFLLVPFRKESVFIRRLIILITIAFIGWVFSFLGYAILPFVVAFMLAYLLDPLVTLLARKKLPRWLVSLFIVLAFVGAVTAVAVFVFPSVFAQLDSAIKTISGLVQSVSSYLESRRFYRLLAKFGISEANVRDVIQKEFIPSMEGFLSKVLKGLLTLLTSLSLVATQIINAILIPILFFYFLKDFKRFRNMIRTLLEQKNAKLVNDIQRIDRILRIYITWQITAAIIVGTVCSVFFSLFNIPYPIVLGVICGLLNPIPYLGSLASLGICIMTVILVNPENLLAQLITVALIINGMHFINAYLLEPNIAGKQVGLHPIVLIASLFVFGGFFGFLGLLIAVPTTATLMMFFNDWRSNIVVPKK